MFRLAPLLIIVILLCGCVSPSKPTAVDTQQNDKLSALASRVQEIEKGKASKEYVDSSDFANNIKSKISIGGYSKAEVDQKISDAVTKAVNELKENQSWVKQQSSTSYPTSYPVSYPQSSGTVGFATIPSSLAYIYSNSSISYTLRLTNNGSSNQYVKPIIILNPIVGTNAIYVTKIRVVMNNSQCNLVGTGWSNNPSYPNTNVLYDGQTPVFSVSPPLGSSYNSAINITPLTTCGGYAGFLVNVGQSVDVQVQITNIEATSGFQWSISNQISSTSY